MNPQNLLVELFVEELPPKALPALGESFARTLAASLQSQGLAAPDREPAPYASPRRLAVLIPAVADKAADKAVAQKLMPVAVGLDADGKPTPALLKKLGSLGLDADAAPPLRREGEGKAETLFIDTVAPGASLAEGLQKALAEAIAKLPIPKVMAYQLEDGWSTVKFVRPAHGLVALHGADVVPVQALGLTAGRQTHGHRFEAQADPIVLRDADSYADQLREQGAVIASFKERRADIAAQLQAAARQAGPGLQPIDDAALLDEVTALVERPNVLLCQFNPAFLAVPQECLILTMKANQKYFPLLDAAGKLTHQFLVVSNISPADPSAVIEGNERVVRPRLADAQFFFEQDRKKRLEDRVPGLDKVVYHAKLGSQGERMRRVQALAGGIAGQILPPVPDKLAERAALLAKTDLLTDMVGEFPELQGIMGRYYALHDGEPTVVAEAIEDHYKPRFSGDGLPRSDVGFALALADKAETLVGLFGIGERPTGDKDPFALRRHALGIIRMLMERGTGIELSRFLGDAKQVFGQVAGFADPSADVQIFLYERLANLLREQGWTAQEVDAVQALKPEILSEVPRRLEAVRAFAALPEAAALAAANKRVGNILRKSDGVKDGSGFDGNALVESAEIALSQALNAVAPQVQQLYAAGDYTAALKVLAALKAPVDTFFDQVMVNAEDPKLRANRLALLARLQSAMNQVADLSRLATLKLRDNADMKLLILDRDGVINQDSDDFIKSPDEWVPIPGSLEAIARLNHEGWHVAVATNQSGIGRGLFDMSTLNAIHRKMHKALAAAGGRIDAIFFCPHAPEDHCSCRKPKPGLFQDIARRYELENLEGVPSVGDSVRDLQAGEPLGCGLHLVRTGKGERLADLGNLPAGTRVHDDLAAFAAWLLEQPKAAPEKTSEKSLGRA